ncbi:MAG: putative toxin-antitoxin system toxin component, PIN family [SAR202 cluster bacterium]|nr:putative toxin-antitoxin system toxin component, PIN family [SAR202 cluster bacterium]
MRSGAAEDRLRAVLDSNVPVSAFAFPGGTPNLILQGVVAGKILAVASPFVLAEVEGVLRNKLRVSEEIIHTSLNFLQDRCLLVDPPGMVAIPDLSPADNRILDCAIATEADYLVTGDKGIQRLREFRGIRIVSPGEFLDVMLRNRGER